MRFRIPLLIALFAARVAAESSVVVAADEPLYTNKTRFRIPFRFDANEMTALGAQEIRLYVSNDQGSQWQHAQSVAPDSGRFEFQATSDGEYWFAVRTLDSRNRMHPQGGPMQPGLKVVVDTAPPELQIRLRQPSSGQVELGWTAFDFHLDPGTLELEFLQPGETVWQQVSVIPQASGRTSWSVTRGGIVAVRGTIRDRASNSGQGQSDLSVVPVEPNDRQPQPQVQPQPAPSFREPIATTIPAQSGAMIHQFQPDSQQPATAFVSSNPNREQAVPTQSASQWPTPADKPRIVNTTKFQIQYSLDDVGPSGVSQVDLYVTQDDGQSWWKYGSDEDHRSPFDVSVPADGKYGFALRVRSGVGLGDGPPQPGEKPSTHVVIDQTPPSVQLLPVQQGQGVSMNKILLRWQVNDDNPTDQPVELSYSANANGPWQPITSTAPNVGTFLWTVGPGVPARVYVQITAHDAAGNTAHARTQEPILIDLSKPTAKIVDVQISTAPATTRF